jgi:hypothetical protein
MLEITMYFKSIPMHDLTIDVQMRFWQKVDIKSKEECWLWEGYKAFDAKRKHYYGRFSLGKLIYQAHRISYAIYYNQDPGQFMVCHSCDTTLCCNPNHLFLGTNSDNQLDFSDKGGILSPYGSRTFSNNQIEQIKIDFYNGMNYYELANKYKTTYQTMRRTVIRYITKKEKRNKITGKYEYDS